MSRDCGVGDGSDDGDVDDDDGSGDGIDSDDIAVFILKKEAHLFSMRSEIAMIRVSNSWCDFFNSSRQSS